MPELYFAHKREVVERDGMLLAVNGSSSPRADERTLRGDRAVPHDRRRHLHRLRRVHARRPCDEVVAEVAAARVTERGATRADDRISEAGMEDRKKEGYF